MAQVTIYLPDDLEKQARKVAKARKMSVSRWIAEQVKSNLSNSIPQSWIDAAGAIPDFPSIEEIRSGYGEDGPRESFD